MKIINNQEEYEDFYYYKNKPTVYPTEYPCVAKRERELRGIMGDEMVMYVTYFPKDVTIEEAFMKGLKPTWINMNQLQYEKFKKEKEI